MEDEKAEQRPRREHVDYRVDIEHSLDRATLAVLKALAAQSNGNDVLERIDGKLAGIRATLETIMPTLAEFETKIDTINTNTTASAAAAGSIQSTLDKLRADVKNMGLSADQEATLLAALDGPIATSGALKTFLEATAAGPTEPPPVEPVPSERGRYR